MTNTIQLSLDLLGVNAIDPRWMTGPFSHLKSLAPRSKGSRMEKIAEEIFRQRGHTVTKATSTDNDRVVDGSKVEIKGSTITKNSDDCFSFLQIRPAQEYDFLVLETFWFDGTVKFHRIPKDAVLQYVADRVFVPQHGGNKGNSGTFCYNGNLAPFAQWFWFEIKVQ
jgi:hypothetical protein